MQGAGGGHALYQLGSHRRNNKHTIHEVTKERQKIKNKKINKKKKR
jgi:hypothetical protein